MEEEPIVDESEYCPICDCWREPYHNRFEQAALRETLDRIGEPSGDEPIAWPIELCCVCKEPVSLFNDKGFMSVSDGEFVHHVDDSKERTCFEKLLDAWAKLWADTHKEPFPVNDQPWIPEESKALGGCVDGSCEI